MPLGDQTASTLAPPLIHHHKLRPRHGRQRRCPRSATSPKRCQRRADSWKVAVVFDLVDVVDGLRLAALSQVAVDRLSGPGRNPAKRSFSWNGWPTMIPPGDADLIVAARSAVFSMPLMPCRTAGREMPIGAQR